MYFHFNATLAQKFSNLVKQGYTYCLVSKERKN